MLKANIVITRRMVRGIHVSNVRVYNKWGFPMLNRELMLPKDTNGIMDAWMRKYPDAHVVVHDLETIKE